MHSLRYSNSNKQVELEKIIAQYLANYQVKITFAENITTLVKFSYGKTSNKTKETKRRILH